MLHIDVNFKLIQLVYQSLAYSLVGIVEYRRRRSMILQGMYRNLYFNINLMFFLTCHIRFDKISLNTPKNALVTDKDIPNWIL